MKKVLVGLFFLLQGCYVAYPPPADPLRPVPYLPHDQSVELYKTAGALPDSLFVPMFVFTAPGSYGAAAQREILRSLAQEYGTNAVIGVGYRPPLDSLARRPFDPTDLYGLGVILPDSLEYVRYFVRNKWTYRFDGPDDSTAALIYRAHFDHLGEEMAPRTGDPAPDYARYVRNYSVDFLIRATRGWAYVPPDGDDPLYQRRYQPGGKPEVAVYFQYDRQRGRVRRMRLKYPGDDREEEYVELKYDSLGRVIEKQILVDDRVEAREFLYHDALSRVELTKYYR
ncbi:MAG: hypothetical protein WBA12_13390, partial [Catalinimonas sp.]